MPNQPQEEVTNQERRELLDVLSAVVHEDFADCSGTGSTFCPGCVAIRAVHALIEVYDEIEVEDIADDVLERYKGGDPDIENIVTVH